MSLLELREANIARNDEMLRALGFGSSTMLRESPEKVKSKPASPPRKIQEEAKKKLAEEASVNLKLIKRGFLHRMEEVNQIWNYMDEHFEAAPPLIVSGATGGGKTDIVLKVVCAHSTPHSYFICSGYSSGKQLLRSLWYTMMLSIFEHGAMPQNAKGAVSSQNSGRIRLIGAMRAPVTFEDFIISLGEAARTHERHSKFHLCVVLDQINEIDELDKSLGQRLLRMTEFCHAGIKVVAIRRVLPAMSGSHTSIIFPPYTMQQVEDIVSQKTVDHYEKKYPKRVIVQLLKKVLPRILQLTKHVGEVFAAIIRTCEKANDDLVEAKQGSASFTLAMNVVNEAINLPSLHMPTHHSRKFPRNREGPDESKKRKRDAEAKGKSQPLSEWTDLGALSTIINTTTLTGTSGCQELPSSWKYLILASYLASNNPKETDDYIFAMKKKGKRKKEKAGTTPKDKERTSGYKAFSLERLLSIFSQISIVSQSNAKAKRDPLQVAKQVEREYGDAQLFAAINGLEAMRYLVRASGWTIDKPMYLSSIQASMATEISLTVNFDLGAYTN